MIIEVKCIIYYMYMSQSTQMVNAHKKQEKFSFSISWIINGNQNHMSFDQNVSS